jgi:hypothetical protein
MGQNESAEMVSPLPGDKPLHEARASRAIYVIVDRQRLDGMYQI